MITYLSAHVPTKVTYNKKRLLAPLNKLREMSGRDYRLYFDDNYGILVDITKNKILWIEDATFSIAIFEVRLNKLLDYWKYEKTTNKTEIDFVRFDNLKKYTKVLYE